MKKAITVTLCLFLVLLAAGCGDSAKAPAQPQETLLQEQPVKETAEVPETTESALPERNRTAWDDAAETEQTESKEAITAPTEETVSPTENESEQTEPTQTEPVETVPAEDPIDPTPQPNTEPGWGPLK